LAVRRLDHSDDVYETRHDSVSRDCWISVGLRNWHRRCRTPVLVKPFDRCCSKGCCYRRVDIWSCWSVVGVGNFPLLNGEASEQERTPNLVLGVKCDNRESVHGSKKVSLTPNIGLEAIQARSGGSASASWRGRTLTTE